MREEDMSTRIKDELQTWKAPADLVARTKEAVARAEAKEVRRHKRIPRYVAGTAALATAAALFLLISPMAIGQEAGIPFQTETSQSEDAAGATASGTWLRLGTAEGREVYLEEEVSLERVAVLPMAFRQTEREEILGGRTVRYARNAEGFWMAAFEDQEKYVVITTQVTDEEEMVAIMEKLLVEE